MLLTQVNDVLGSIKTVEFALICVNVAVMFLIISKFSNISLTVALTIAFITGIGSGMFLWPWIYIIFGWPGASLGAAISSALRLRNRDLVPTGALISAALAMSALGVGMGLLIVFLLNAIRRGVR